MTLVARVEDGMLHTLVRDHGCGIRPPADTPVLGHGLALMDHVAAALQILGSPAGTDVTMSFQLAARHDSTALSDFDEAA
jgi:hypothetical protein